MAFSFQLTGQDDKSGARTGLIQTDHGPVKTPVFMPVGTQGTVKTLSPQDLRDLASPMMLSNTYHLYLRPGHDLIREIGGLHTFSAWDRPILTDSGGFQVFSLGKLRKINEEGVRFQSHIDGSSHLITPERSIEIQQALGSDIMMAFDECTPYPATREYAKNSMELTHRWAARCKEAWTRDDLALFGIVQGGMYQDLRVQSVDALAMLDLPGYAIGGLSVGESKDMMREMTQVCTDRMPTDKPRYLMGVGTPEDILSAIAMGVDMFDCVLPTRNARNGTLFTSLGKINIKNARHADDPAPLDPNCACTTCTDYSRAYLRHLYRAGEVSVLRLLTQHNLYFYFRMMENAQIAIAENRYLDYYQAFFTGNDIGLSN